MNTDHNHLNREPGKDGARIVLSAYESLRFGGRPLIRALQYLFLPAVRLHRVRNTRTRMWREAICVNDCSAHSGSGKAAPVNKDDARVA